MDGGSTDETEDILQRYSKWFTYWQSMPDGGQTHAIQEGFARTTGEALNWINSDDGLLPGALRDIGLNIADYDVVIGNSVYKNSRSAFYTLTTNWPKAFRMIGGAVPQHSTFWHKRVHLGVNPQIQCAMDLDLWIRMMGCHVSVKRIQRAIGYANMHPAQKQSDSKFRQAWDSDAERIRSTQSFLIRTLAGSKVYGKVFEASRRCQKAFEVAPDYETVKAAFPGLDWTFECRTPGGRS
jgi:glycosyltransferase involved in cell wall biosynthesis